MAGGILDQTSQFNSAMEIIDRMVREHENNEAKKRG